MGNGRKKNKEDIRKVLEKALKERPSPIGEHRFDDRNYEFKADPIPKIKPFDPFADYPPPKVEPYDPFRNFDPWEIERSWFGYGDFPNAPQDHEYELEVIAKHPTSRDYEHKFVVHDKTTGTIVDPRHYGITFDIAERSRYEVTFFNEYIEDLNKSLPVTKSKTAGTATTIEPTEMQGALMDVFLAGAQVLITKGIEERTGDAVKQIEDHLDTLKKEIEKHKSITIVRDGREVSQIKGLTHKDFPSLLSALQLGFPILLVGVAGSGKTFSAEQAAEAMGIPFYSISVGLQTSKSDLFGYMSASGEYVPTAFRKAYEHGGLFLLDEADAGNANVLVMLNSALSGNLCAFPDQMVKRHADFYLIATANTYGTGASRVYVGRNQLDAATLDRFIVLDWEIDDDLEAALVSKAAKGKAWHTVVKAVRTHVRDTDMRVIVSPRATMKGALLLDAGVAFDKVVEAVLLPTATKEQRTALAEKAKRAWKE